MLREEEVCEVFSNRQKTGYQSRRLGSIVIRFFMTFHATV
jgi:hypothetical protein